ncbi:MAG: CoA transferase [Alphaproteobacteria bacterium]|nr:CoA transferase [Alphaproteobacteria bacterium]
MDALKTLRVLDLSDELGAYAAKLLADLGAEVIRVDPPGKGLLERAPYLDTTEKISLFDIFFNQNKKRVTLDLSNPMGRDLLGQLWRKCDVVIWSSLDGVSDPRWPMINALRGDSKQIVCLITPFGLDGPYAQFVASDAVIMAMGGFLSLSGYPDCPVVPFGEQSFYAASLHATLGIIIAHIHRLNNNEGQEVRVCAQEAIAHALENAIQYVDLENHIRGRTGDEEPAIGTGVFKCQDGYVYLMAYLHGTPLRWNELVDWLTEAEAEGAQTLKDQCWSDPKHATRHDAKAKFRQIFEGFAASRDKLELYEEGQRRGVNICPLNTLADCAQNPQLRLRGFFRPGHVSSIDRDLAFPAPPFRLSGFDPAPIRASSAGEQGREILAAFGQAKGQMARQKVV